MGVVASCRGAVLLPVELVQHGWNHEEPRRSSEGRTHLNTYDFAGVTVKWSKYVYTVLIFYLEAGGRYLVFELWAFKQKWVRKKYSRCMFSRCKLYSQC